jgi:mRNA interferase MazF
VIVQNDPDNQRMTNTIIAQITTNVARAGEPTQLLIEISTPDGALTGLLHDSLISCNNLATIEQTRINRVIGSRSPSLLAQMDLCLKAALGLP